MKNTTIKTKGQRKQRFIWGKHLMIFVNETHQLCIVFEL